MKAQQLTIIYNAKIHTSRGTFSGALRLEEGRIVRCGTKGEILDGAPLGTRKIDACGSFVIPAFHDSHLHLLWLGRRTGMIEAAGAASLEEVLKRGRNLIARLKPSPGTYVQGAGVNPDLFTGEKRDPTRYDLDRISREHPVIISRHCGHTVYCNSLALMMAGLGESAPDVEGGTIEKDRNGKPTGVLRENANALVREPIPALSRTETLKYFGLAVERALSLGITAVGTYDTGGPDFEEILGAYREICSNTRRLRITMQCGISGKEEYLDAYLEQGLFSGKVFCEEPGTGPLIKMGPVKLFIDGTLGGQTAWMREPYRDKPGTKGFPVLEEALLEKLVKKAASAGLQVEVHAIGDAGVGAVVSAFEKVTGPANPLRHGVIHCQITRQEDLERMAKSRILALVQPIFLADDMQILENRIGPALAATSYAWGSMHRLGIPVSYGTDAPVSPLDPLLNIAWAVRRRDPESGLPRGGFYPAERVDVFTALDAYTSGSAYSDFSEQYLGRIKPGYYADLAFIDKDIFSVPPEELYKAKVIRTMLAGETVWEGY